MRLFKAPRKDYDVQDLVDNGIADSGLFPKQGAFWTRDEEFAGIWSHYWGASKDDILVFDVRRKDWDNFMQQFEDFADPDFFPGRREVVIPPILQKAFDEATLNRTTLGTLNGN